MPDANARKTSAKTALERLLTPWANINGLLLEPRGVLLRRLESKRSI
jgi:hypothetical protein